MRNLHNPSIIHPIVIFFVLSILIFASACGYYKVVDRSPKKFASYLQSAKNVDQKVFYLHGHSKVIQIKDVKMEGLSLSAHIVPDSAYQPQAIPDYNYRTRRSSRLKKDNKSILNEVHLYLNPSQVINGTDSILLLPGEIASIEIIKHDGVKELTASVLSAAAILTIVAIIDEANEPEPEPYYVSGSCPYAYAFNGQDFIFEGELYTGALFQNLERDDYLYLPSIRPSNDQFVMRLKNKLNEREYTNVAELIVVDHPQGSIVYFDHKGKAFTISQQVAPLQAISSSGENQLPYIAEKDRYYYSFDDIQNDEQELILSFSKPANTQTGKLLLSTKNTTWGDQVIQAFMSKMGNSYSAWQSQEETKTQEERISDFLKWEFPVSVSIKNGIDWQLAGYIFPVGPLGERDIVLPLNLSNHNGDIIEFKLSSGFQFWDINQVVLDFSENLNLHMQQCKPTRIATEHMTSFQSILDDDMDYIVMQNGDFIDLHFDQPKLPSNMEQSVFLHVKGYYEYTINSTAEPDLVALKKFDEPGYFSDFSKMMYQKQLKELEKLVSKQ